MRKIPIIYSSGPRPAKQLSIKFVPPPLKEEEPAPAAPAKAEEPTLSPAVEEVPVPPAEDPEIQDTSAGDTTEEKAPSNSPTDEEINPQTEDE